MTSARDDAVRAALAELRAQYVSELPGRLDDLAAAVRRARSSEGELAEAQSLAHRICGTAGSYGFTSLSDAVGRIEQVFKDAAARSSQPRGDAWQEIDAALSDALSTADRIRAGEMA